MRLRALVLLVAVSVFGLGLTGAASAKPTTGSFTVTFPVSATVTVDATDITISGTLTANVSRFTVQDSHVVAVTTLSGTLTATSDLGTATIDLIGTRVVLNADVQADCQGHLHIDFRGVLQLRAMVTFTTSVGSFSFDVNETIPMRGSIDFTAQTQQQTSLICDLSRLLDTRASVNAAIDKLNTLLKTL
jgi:hypothetical protein